MFPCVAVSTPNNNKKKSNRTIGSYFDYFLIIDKNCSVKPRNPILHTYQDHPCWSIYMFPQSSSWNYPAYAKQIYQECNLMKTIQIIILFWRWNHQILKLTFRTIQLSLSHIHYPQLHLNFQVLHRLIPLVPAIIKAGPIKTMIEHKISNSINLKKCIELYCIVTRKAII